MADSQPADHTQTPANHADSEDPTTIAHRDIAHAAIVLGHLRTHAAQCGIATTSTDTPQAIFERLLARSHRIDHAAGYALAALTSAETTCRYHGDVRAPRSLLSSGCGSCQQPARVRDAIAALIEVYGGEPLPRAYTVDTTSTDDPGRARVGLWPVTEIRGLFVRDDPDLALRAICAALVERGETGPLHHVRVNFKRAAPDWPSLARTGDAEDDVIPDAATHSMPGDPTTEETPDA